MPKKSLFDDIFRLQSAAPDEDVDPEDLEEGLKASLVEGVDDSEFLASSSLRKKAAIIPDDPRYKGKKTSRKSLYSDDEEDKTSLKSSDVDSEDVDSEASTKQSGSEVEEGKDEDAEEDSDVDNTRAEESMEQSGSDDGEDDDDGDENDEMEEANEEEKDDTIILQSKTSDERDKGKAVVFQLGVWDDLIKGRIAMQKLVSACNCLPQPDVWADFEENETFKKEARNVHSSVRKLLSALLELQSHLSSTVQSNNQKSGKEEGSDEEITSESENEEDGVKKNANGIATDKSGGGSNDDEGNESADEDDDEDEDDQEEEDDVDDEMQIGKAPESPSKSKFGEKLLSDPHHHQHRGRQKRKLDVGEVEETLAKRHKDFQSFRNDTLSKWDEKTRLTQGKVKAKNFAAFEVPILKQIEQVLVNRDRLVRRIHQKRAEYKIVGKTGVGTGNEKDEVEEVEDDDDDVELKLKQQKSKHELNFDSEIIDDNDFYHVCLRDLIEMKQNEETDPVTANKQWLEIQRLRNKQKKKVDTRASKGRKIRYNVKEKLKNFMTPYDKSSWSDEQKDDLFKALFGGRESREDESNVSDDHGFVLGL